MSTDLKAGPRLLSPLRAFDFGSVVTGLAFLRDGTLAVGLGDGSVRLIAPEREPVTVRPHAEGAAVLKLAADVDGQSVLTGGDDGLVMRSDAAGETTRLAAFPGQQVDVLTAHPAAGLRAVAAGRELRLLDREGKTVAATADHPSTVADVAFNPKGKRLAVAHYGGVTLWWAASLGRNPTRLAWRGSHLQVTWSPDGSTVLTAMQGNDLHGWRIADDQHMRMEGYPTKIRSLAWLKKPMTLLTSGADRVIGWRFTGGGPMGKGAIEFGTGNGRPVTRVAVDPIRPRLAAGFDDGYAILCSTVADEVIDLPTDAEEAIEALVWSEDGNRLAIGTEGGRVALFEVPVSIP